MAFLDLLSSADKAAIALLGEAVIYTPTTGSPSTVSGIFDSQYEHVDAGHTGVSSTGPAVFVRLADLPADPESDPSPTLTIRGNVYLLKECEKDGQGGALLRLFVS